MPILEDMPLKKSVMNKCLKYIAKIDLDTDIRLKATEKLKDEELIGEISKSKMKKKGFKLKETVL